MATHVVSNPASSVGSDSVNRLVEMQLSENLQAGLSSLADLPGVVTLEQPAWYPQGRKWAVHLRIAADTVAGGPIPQVTDWFALVGDNYPDDSIGILPAKVRGITQTFPHQDFNGVGRPDRPWRTGKLCTWTQAAPLQRRGYDIEPAEPSRNLAWHVERAQTWLELASRNELVEAGDYYELPYVPGGDATKAVFAESSATLEQWLVIGRRCGEAHTEILETASPNFAVTRFVAGKGGTVIQQEWGRDLDSRGNQSAVWVRSNSVPILEPYQLPASWGELRQALKEQSIDLDRLLRPAVLRPINYSMLLIGFPIPEKVGGPNLRMHWLALRLPEQVFGLHPGFRNNARGKWLEYKQSAIPDGAALQWLKTENWHQDEISVRGRLSEAAAHSPILIIGAGAVGSVLSEMLARAGVRNLTVIDRDLLEAGNLVRHTLLVSDLGLAKATGVADRLTDATLHTQISGIEEAFPPGDAESAEYLRSAGVVIDTTGDDDTIAAMSRFPWCDSKTFISVSLGLHARRLFFFAAHGTAFPGEEFTERLLPWLRLEGEDYDPYELPRDGPGCWHPRHPARIDDVWMMTAAAVKLIEQAIDNPPTESTLAVLEQQEDEEGNFTGIGMFKDYDRPR